MTSVQLQSNDYATVDELVYATEPTPRPNMIRRDTEGILSYYQSEHAGKTYAPDGLNDQGTLPPQPATVERSFSSSSSSSVYSSDLSPRSSEQTPNEPIPDHGAQLNALEIAGGQHRWRSNDQFEGGADTQRVGVTGLDTPSTPSLSFEPGSRGTSEANTSPDTLLSRRGLGSRVHDLALSQTDAPFDTLPGFVPPSSAPVAGSFRVSDPVHRGLRNSTPTGHQRSISEAVHERGRDGVHRKTSSRDIGIVGTRRIPELGGALTTHGDPTQSLKPYIFQTPKSRPPSPQVSLNSPVDAFPRLCFHSPSLPRYFPSPRLARRLAVAASSSHPSPSSSGRIRSEASVDSGKPSPTPSIPCFPASQPSSYLYYQPGFHSTAGPLPPPPRAMFQIDHNIPPPPRPPRLRSPSPARSRHSFDDVAKSSAVSVILASKSSVTSLKRRDSTRTSESSRRSVRDVTNASDAGNVVEGTFSHPSSHVREGAFPPSRLILQSASMESQQSPEPSSKASQAGLTSAPSSTLLHSTPVDIVPLPPVISEPAMEVAGAASQSRAKLRRDNSSLSLRPRSPDGSRASLDSSNGRPSTDLDSLSLAPTSSRGSPKGKKEGLSTNPLRGTLTNLKRFSSLPRTPSIVSGKLSNSSRSSRTPSPPSVPSRPKIHSNWPRSMSCNDVLVKRSSLERAIAYAQKINDLSMYDCGLGDWVVATKQKANSRNPTRAAQLGPAAPSVRPMSVQPRHTSNGSVSSQATFPLRPDAYTATDLSPRPTDTLPPPNAPPPALPYPALAQATNYRLSVVSSSASARSTPFSASKSTGGFFSSIGRNHTQKKEKERSANTSGKVLVKPNPNANPRPIVIVEAPSVPGGPRVAPGRTQRSQTLMLSTVASETSASSGLNRRRSNTIRRPSFLNRSGNASEVDPEFVRQVDKLADLLPHADRDILAGYLRRAGQDILAIGQYLEDEKNGTLRRD